MWVTNKTSRRALARSSLRWQRNYEQDPTEETEKTSVCSVVSVDSFSRKFEERLRSLIGNLGSRDITNHMRTSYRSYNEITEETEETEKIHLRFLRGLLFVYLPLHGGE